ncbi:tetratricopeptide repeat protein [Scytonema sp. PCC 10023]|uniref:tetratricopeptide repeat protein n=1 Tax=Scytonema sp. PCC 10023 TaxID=1680591 RepID=UPI0039C62F83
MARASYGDDVKARVRLLLEKFLAYANDELEDCQRYKIDLNWQTPNQVIVRTNLRELAKLAALDKEQVREALKRLQDFLGILKDEREHPRGSENWHFQLTLWHNKDDKQANLNKFDQEWQRRRDNLPGVQRTEKRKPKPTPTRYDNLRPSGATNFVGREKELQDLHQLLQENDRVAIAAIAGMGGVGKTELALQYAIAHRESYQGGICWLLALQDVGLNLVKFARTHLDLNPPEISPDFDLLAQVQYCWRNWREGEVLLVLDNVTDYKQVKPYLPTSSSRFKVLMTTRQRLGVSIAKLSLDVLQPEAALELLQSLVGVERIEKENDLTPLPPSLVGKGELNSPLLQGEGLGERSNGELVALQLCEWLGYLPLGLELVGRYLARKEDLSLAEMLRRLEKKRLEQPALVKPEDDMTAQQGVQAAFELSWQELNDTDKQLACLLSLFAPAPIPWELVQFCLPDVDAEELEESRDDKLINLHLLQRKEKGIYQLHPLLREFFQAKLTELDPPNLPYQGGQLDSPLFKAGQGGDLKQAFATAMVAVAKKIPDNPILELITAVSPGIPHLAEVANNLIQYVSDKDFIWAFVGNARFYAGQGLYNQAALWYEQCLEVTKKRLGEEHFHVAQSRNNLAELYRSQGRYTEAEPLYQKALELMRRLLGEEHLLVTLSLNNLALLYESQGKYTEAEPLYQKVLELMRGLLGEEHLHVALSLNNLAGLYRSQGRYTEAEPLYQQALELRRHHLGEEHPDVATSLNNLALLYHSQGRYTEAEPLCQQALQLRRCLLGEEHPDVAISLNNLALLYESQGRYTEAEALHQQALLLTRRLLGEEHPDVAISLNNLALVYESQGRYTEAEALHQQALLLTRRLLGEEHPYVAQSLNNLAKLYRCQGRYSQAELLCQQALQLRRRLLGEEHPDVAITLNNLALLYRCQGRYSQAEPLYLQALEISERRLGVGHPFTITVRRNYAICLRRGDF